MSYKKTFMSFCLIWQWAREEKILGNRLFANFLYHISVGESRKLRFFVRDFRGRRGWCQTFIFSYNFLSSFIVALLEKGWNEELLLEKQNEWLILLAT